MFYFLDLPRELRNTIYRFYIRDAGHFTTGNAQIRYQDLEDEDARAPERLGNEKHALSYVCRAVQEEYHQELGLTKAEQYELVFCPPRVSCYLGHQQIETYSETVDLGTLLRKESSSKEWMHKRIAFTVDFTRFSDKGALPNGRSTSITDVCTKHAKEPSSLPTDSPATTLVDERTPSSVMGVLLGRALTYLNKKHAACKVVHLAILHDMPQFRAGLLAPAIYDKMFELDGLFAGAMDVVHVQVLNRSGPGLYGRYERQANQSFLKAQHEWR